ncbi:hypothetical protein EV177_006721, partial [Coemansia sp. RSA 1804]
MPNAVTVCDPDDIRVLLNNSDVNKASHYKILRFTGIDNTLSFLKTEDALVRHRQMGPFLKSAYLSKMEDTIMREGVQSIKQKWDTLLDQSKTGSVEYLKKAVGEIRSQFSCDHVITYKECREQLPFLEACIFESLRLEPVTGGTLAREAPKGGLTIKEHFIPEGTTVTVNFAAANRHHRHWDNPLEFNPSRFVGNKSAQNKIMTFSYGRRTCPGRQLAWWKIFTIIANVLKDYDLALSPNCKQFGPGVLDKNGYPKTMDWRMFINIKPENSD